MENRKYFLANGIPNQPFADIRCYITKDTGDEYVMIRCADIRLADCPESITKRTNLTAFPEDKAEITSHKNGLVSFSV